MSICQNSGVYYKDDFGIKPQKYMKYQYLNVTDVKKVRTARKFDDVLEINCKPSQVVYDLVQLVQEEDYFYVFNLGDLVEKYQEWIQLMPRISPVYALRCVNHPLVLKLLVELNMNFQCTSRREIEDILNKGVNQDNIIFSGPVKQFSDVTYAASQNVRQVTFDCECELRKCKKWFSKARLLISIRCTCANSSSEFDDNVDCAGDVIAPGLLDLAKLLKMNVIGVAVEVGDDDKTAYSAAINCARNVHNYGKKLGFKLYKLHITGGFPGERKGDLAEFAQLLNDGIDKCFPNRDVVVSVEPGPYFVKTAFSLCCKIQSVKYNVYLNRTYGNSCNRSLKFEYYFSSGMLHLLNSSLTNKYDLVPTIIKQHDLLKNNTYKSDIYEVSHIGVNIVIKNVYLPKIDFGDWLMFENIGCYSVRDFYFDKDLPKYNVYIISSASALKLLRGIAPGLFD